MAIVYLSSTRLDLSAERDAVTAALQKAKHDVRHSYRASPEPVVKACIADVEASDVYLLLTAKRYGSRPPLDNAEDLSITELEFRAARAAGKPVIALFQDNPVWEHTDYAKKDAVAIEKLERFHADVQKTVTWDHFANTEQLNTAVLTGVTEAIRKLEDKRREHAPPITPGVNRPHPRLLSRALLVVHAAGTDDALARRLTDTLMLPGIAWRVERCALDVEAGLDWLEFERQLAESRAVALLLSGPSAGRFGAQPEALRPVLDFVQRQCGFSVAFTCDVSDAAVPWLGKLPLRQRHALDAWAAAPVGTITPDLAQAVAQMRALHPDIDDPRLVGLQYVVMAMTRAEAEALRDQPALLGSLGEEQRRFYADAVAHLSQSGTAWVDRYGVNPEDWQPFGPGPAGPRPALSLLREVINEINRQAVVPRRDQEALLGHRIRLRGYPSEPLVAEDPRWLQLFEQVRTRRYVLLVDELSLCHPRLRAALGDLLADPNSVVATIAPFDPPALTVEAALRGNSVFKLGSLVSRFLYALDPQCEINLGSSARLRRWLRVNIPETLASFSSAALDDRRARIRSEAGLA